MPVDLSRIMVTDSMLQLLLVRYACIWRTPTRVSLSVSRRSGGNSVLDETETYVGLGEIRV